MYHLITVKEENDVCARADEFFTCRGKSHLHSQTLANHEPRRHVPLFARHVSSLLPPRQRGFQITY